MTKITRKEVFKRLDVLTIEPATSWEDLDDTSDFWKAINEISDYMDHFVHEISDHEAWVIINFLDRIPLQITDGYWSGFMTPVLESAPGWPYSNDLLLRIPKGEGGGIVDIKSEALTDGAKMQINTPGLPFEFKPAGLNLEDYWEKINWKELTEGEFRFILLVISERGSDMLKELQMSSGIFSAVDKFPELKNVNKSEWWGRQWLKEHLDQER